MKGHCAFVVVHAKNLIQVSASKARLKTIATFTRKRPLAMLSTAHKSILQVELQ